MLFRDFKTKVCFNKKFWNEKFNNGFILGWFKIYVENIPTGTSLYKWTFPICKTKYSGVTVTDTRTSVIATFYSQQYCGTWNFSGTVQGSVGVRTMYVTF